MASVVIVLKGLVEFAGLLLLARGAVFVLSFGKHSQNPIYQALVFLTRPLVRVARAITPAAVVDRHVAAVAFFLLFWVWVGLVLLKATYAPVGPS
ncbi:hypothetical protein [Zeimonas arvi]|uniref:YggT family protein n=1 Tax=Zeimonas arvi TaxID=2498847 RepID=A0A5C8NPT5_9BURK|nr:hypothetical protein [Zeimonas arvi]TXL62453.1 hypothetical protein FHP08_17980 [Zeimonas arvi]